MKNNPLFDPGIHIENTDFTGGAFLINVFSGGREFLTFQKSSITGRVKKGPKRKSGNPGFRYFSPEFCAIPENDEKVTFFHFSVTFHWKSSSIRIE